LRWCSLALILALDPLSIMYANMLVTETLFTFAWSGSLTLVSYIRSYRLGWLILSACMFAGRLNVRSPIFALVLLPFVVAGGVTNMALSLRFAFTAISLTYFGWCSEISVLRASVASSTAEFILTYYSAGPCWRRPNKSKKTARARIDDMIKAQAPADLFRRDGEA
jgi:hypothetical protein